MTYKNSINTIIVNNDITNQSKEGSDGDEIDEFSDINSDNGTLLSNNDDCVDDVATEKKEIVTIGNIPPKALLNGLYCGPIPDELRDLNFIEISMISIHNPVTKIRVEGL